MVFFMFELILVAIGVYNLLNMSATLVIDTQPPQFSIIISYPNSATANAPTIVTYLNCHGLLDTG